MSLIFEDKFPLIAEFHKDVLSIFFMFTFYKLILKKWNYLQNKNNLEIHTGISLTKK